MPRLRGKFHVALISDDVHILAAGDDDAVKMQRKYYPQSSHMRLKLPHNQYLPIGSALYLEEDFLIPYTYTYLKPPETVP